ncbi:hypothetical protein DVH05_014455 [Phytophthora capsici]|nr:hypothetical protein DVH05_014546 [Phytophthora capsici]KAG1699085.1 hypothetical protein DVH05_014455 [Phytophthora capsici]
MTDAQKKPDEDVFGRLLHDLQTKPSLCHVMDYPGVELDKLNRHVKTLYPFENPAFGEQPAFFIDQDNYTPYRTVVDGTCEVAPRIGSLVDQWASWTDKRGTVALSSGAFVMNHLLEFSVRWPDVTYTPRKDDRKLAMNQVWIYRGEPFVPTFVVEIEKLSGEGSRLSFLDNKMRNEYFQHGVWLIDPRPDCHKMYEYYLDEHGQVQCSDDTTWRNLDGRDVLPGFTLLCVELEMALEIDPGSMSEEEEDLVCPYSKCRQIFKTRGAIAAHVAWHFDEHAIQRYLAKKQKKLLSK